MGVLRMARKRSGADASGQSGRAPPVARLHPRFWMRKRRARVALIEGPSSGGCSSGSAEMVLGITSVREVVPTKRHKRTIQRKHRDAMHGSLYRFDSVRVAIIATSRSSKGTDEAAFACGAAPITLIDGDKFIDLQIEHGIGVRKRTLEVLTVGRDAFADLEEDA